MYQPIVDLQTMQTYGVEALLRWNRPGHGVVGPTDFIPRLEQDGFIADVGNWVLNEACRQGATWERLGIPLTVSVNVSALQLNAGTFAPQVQDALTASGLAPSHLVIEITESVLMREPDAMVRILKDVHGLGVRIAIDDFGTGYSSLSYLRQFPIDALKIDQSFVAEMADSTEAATLVRTLVGLGQDLGITTTAEGIEDVEQLVALQGEKCESGQGYLLARPMPAEEVATFLEEWSRVHPQPVTVSG